MTRWSAFILAALMAAAVPALAQDPAPLHLTLEDALTRADTASHRLAEAGARVEAARAIADQRRAATNPQVAAQAGYTRTNHVDTFGILLPNNQFRVIYPDIPDNYRTRLDLQWPIFTGGRLNALERAARAEASASAEDVEVSRADLRLEVTRAFWALVTARESLRVVDEAVKRATAHVQDVRSQFAAGLVPPNDVAAAEAQLSRQRMLEAQAAAQHDVTEFDMARLIDAPPGVSIDPAVALEPPAPVGDPANTLVVRAREQRRERTALTTRIGAARERVRAASAGRLPTVGVGGGFDYARPNPRLFPREEAWKTSWDASVNVSWPVFDGGRTRAEISEAVAQQRAAEERLAEFDAVLGADVRQRARELESSHAAIDAATDAVRATTEARRVVEDRFKAGVATSTDVLESQVALLQAELDRTQAIAAARLAEARLARALGK